MPWHDGMDEDTRFDAEKSIIQRVQAGETYRAVCEDWTELNPGHITRLFAKYDLKSPSHRQKRTKDSRKEQFEGLTLVEDLPPSDEEVKQAFVAVGAADVDPTVLLKDTAEKAVRVANAALENEPNNVDLAQSVAMIISRCSSVLKPEDREEEFETAKVLELWNS